MDLLLITGFLGSGKTTFIVNLLQQATISNKRVAILVNEIGEIGIDGQLMRQLDLDVWELTNGCVCCSLSADLVRTLENLDQCYDVDLVIVEPSGAANPDNILKGITRYKGRAIESIKSIAIIDPLRIEELYEIMTPLITKQIESTSVMIINKADITSPLQLQSARKISRMINSSGQLFTLSANQPLPLDLLKEII